MKKLVIILIALAFSSSYPQFIKSYGIKGGATVSNMAWRYSSQLDVSDIESDNKLGLNLGLFAEILDLPYMRLVTEVNFVHKGAQKDILVTTPEYPEGTGKTILWKIGFNYLDFSLLLKPYMEMGSIKPYLLIGPRFDFEIGKTMANDNESAYEGYKKNRFGMKLGFGSELTVLDRHLLFEFVYDPDLSNIFENEFVKVDRTSFDLRIGIFL